MLVYFTYFAYFSFDNERWITCQCTHAYSQATSRPNLKRAYEAKQLFITKLKQLKQLEDRFFEK